VVRRFATRSKSSAGWQQHYRDWTMLVSAARRFVGAYGPVNTSFRSTEKDIARFRTSSREPSSTSSLTTCSHRLMRFTGSTVAGSTVGSELHRLEAEVGLWLDRLETAIMPTEWKSPITSSNWSALTSRSFLPVHLVESRAEIESAARRDRAAVDWQCGPDSRRSQNSSLRCRRGGAGKNCARCAALR
jgi:hypothetical protein